MTNVKHDKLALAIRSRLAYSYVAIRLAFFVAVPIVVKILAARRQSIVLSCFSDDLVYGLVMLFACGAVTVLRLLVNRNDKSALGERCQLRIAALLVLVAFLAAVNAWQNISSRFSDKNDSERLEAAQRAMEHDPLGICKQDALDAVKEAFTKNQTTFLTARIHDEWLQLLITTFWALAAVLSICAFSMIFEAPTTAAGDTTSKTDIGLVVIDDTNGSAMCAEKTDADKDQY